MRWARDLRILTAVLPPRSSKTGLSVWVSGITQPWLCCGIDRSFKNGPIVVF